MITKAYEREMETLGAFEVSSKMLKLAQGNEKHKTFLNAGRGNPQLDQCLGTPRLWQMGGIWRSGIGTDHPQRESGRLY